MKLTSATLPALTFAAFALVRCDCSDDRRTTPDAGAPADSGFDAGFDVGQDGGAVEPDAGATLDFATLASGTGPSKKTSARAIARDSAGNVYLAGGTNDPSFPTTAGAYQRTFDATGASVGSDGPWDAFVMKFAPDGTLVWSTLLGGPNYDRAYAIQVDSSGVYVAGRAGEGFPTTSGVVQPAFAGDSTPGGAEGAQDGFVAKLSLDGKSLLWSTYFGDPISAYVRDLGIDTTGNVYLAVARVRSNFPHLTAGAFQTARSGGTADHDAAVAKLDPAAATVVWCSLLGGSGDDGLFPTMAVSGDGTVTLAQDVASTDAPLKDFDSAHPALQKSFGGGATDLLISRFSKDGSSLVFSTYFGGNGADVGETHNLAVASGEVFIASTTSSSNLPATAGALQPSRGTGSTTPYLVHLSADGSSLLGCSYLGGNCAGSCAAEGVAIDQSGNLVVSGTSDAADFPVTSGATQAALKGGRDAFLAVVAPDLKTLRFATLLGGSGTDKGRALAVGPAGVVFVAGDTGSSSDFPVTPGASQSKFGGSLDAFLARWTVR